MDHIPNRQAWRSGAEAGLVTRARYLTRPSILILVTPVNSQEPMTPVI
jgi:hypothetical protein